MKNSSHNHFQTGKCLVVDCRLAAALSSNSGIARVVVEMVSHLGPLLSRTSSSAKVLLIFESAVPQWALKVEEQCGGSLEIQVLATPFCLRPFGKLRWLWATWAARKLRASLPSRSCWLAPGNFDGPIKGLGDFRFGFEDLKVVQWIHDLIPLERPESVNRLYRWQFGFFVKRALWSSSLLIAVSRQTQQRLLLLRKGPTDACPRIILIQNGVQRIFGSLPRLSSQSRMEARAKFLKSRGEPVEFCNWVWIVGVGRSQGYKRWELAHEICCSLGANLNRGVLFLKVGGEQWNPGADLSPSLQIMEPNDEDLLQIYRISDFNIHTSEAEGFGLPPLESIFCGTPTIFRKGTAVEEHFANADFPDGFVTGIDSSDVSDWTLAIKKSLALMESNNTQLAAFLMELEEGLTVRSEVEAKLGMHRYTWTEAAEALNGELNQLWEDA